MTDTNLKEGQQLFAAGDLVQLFELDITSLGGGVLRFTSGTYESTPATWDSNIYIPINVEAGGFDYSGVGAFPTPTLKLSNVEFSTRAAIQGFNDLVGGTLTRIVTFSRYLDDGADPDTTAKFPDDVYIINQKIAQNKIYVEWELKAAIDLENVFLPKRQVLKDSCDNIYRFYDPLIPGFDYSKATCPYTGANSYDINNDPTTDANDVCGKRFSSCRTRFGQFSLLPFGGFPGVAVFR